MFELPESEVGPEEARDLADQVLSGRAYVEAARPPSLQERLFDWLGEQIGDLFNALSTTGGRGLVAWFVIGAFAALIAFLLTRLFRNLDPLPRRTPTPGPVIDVMSHRSADDWLLAAAQAEAEGDWHMGVRCRHRSLVASLLLSGVISAKPGQTAGEIHRTVAKRCPEADSSMQEATWLFKDTWYGWIEADASTSERFAQASEQVLNATERTLVTTAAP